jgi:hypothetical protein
LLSSVRAHEINWNFWGPGTACDAGRRHKTVRSNLID